MSTFDSHPKSTFWSNKNIVKPNQVALNSHKKFWFDCECGHDFESSLLNINQANNWCPYCYNRKLCGNCDVCYNKSFASHPKSICWSDKNEIKSNEVLKGSEKKYYFNCDICNHELLISLKKISSQGRWCSYCSHQKLCENNECQICWINSFASVEKSKYLNNKTLNPRMLFKSTNKKISFDCDVCKKVFLCQLASVTKGVWCSNCVNKTEKILYDKLVKKYDSLKRQYKVDWCKNIKHLPFDFVIEERKIIIELDGKQHFEQIGKWPSPEETRKNDIFKMKCANKNGFCIIRILQKDIYNNKYDWINELCENIIKITNENRVQNIYMCKNNEYKDFEIN
jgi:very-short-patch-repair endonuclease